MNVRHFLDQIEQNGYYIFDNFLEESSADALQQLAFDSHQHFKAAGIGQKQQQQSDIRRDQIYWLEEKDKSPAVGIFFKTVQDLMMQLNQAFFLNVNHFEAHFSMYRPGDFYKKHIDQFQADKTRRISCVYYLNKDWDCSLGGELKLYNIHDQLLTTVYPIWNRFICFRSELPHEVEKTKAMRLSITGWIKHKKFTWIE